MSDMPKVVIMNLRKENKLFAIEGGTLPLVTTLALLSRHVFNQEVAELVGGHYNRSILEHGAEAFVVAVLVQMSVKYSAIRAAYVLGLGYIFLTLNWEWTQAIERGGILQWEQLLGTASGAVLGFTFHGILNLLEKSVSSNIK